MTFEFTLHEPYVFEGLAAWQPLMKMDEAALKKTLADPAFRAAVKDELAERTRRMFNGEWEKMFVTQAARPENAGFEGALDRRRSRGRRKHPLDFLLDLSLAEGLDTLFTATLLNSDEEAVGRMLRDPNSIVSLSDAGAHLTFLCDAGFGLHSAGPLGARSARHAAGAGGAQALRPSPRSCSASATADGSRRDNGPTCCCSIRRRSAAASRERVFDLPAGASRLTTPGVGVHGVWVNGQRMADADGIVADAPMAGRVLREFAT